MLGHPKLIKFNKKYKALLEHYNNGNCTINEMIETIEILEKIKKNFN